MHILRSTRINDTHFTFSNPDYTISQYKEIAQNRETSKIKWKNFGPFKQRTIGYYFITTQGRRYVDYQPEDYEYGITYDTRILEQIPDLCGMVPVAVYEEIEGKLKLKQDING